LNGKKISLELKDELKVSVDRYREQTGKVPGLTVIIVGEDPASQVYVRNKAKTCKEIGMNSSIITMPTDTPQEHLLDTITSLNLDPAVHGHPGAATPAKAD